MKKVVISVLLLSTLSITSLKAQVTIGSNKEPHPGAVLDLKSDNLGLLLPQVSLKENPHWWALDFGGESDTVSVKKSGIGMIVFNIAEVQDGQGLYFWDGTKWTKLGNKIQEPPETLANYIISGCTSFLFTYQQMTLSLVLSGGGETPNSYQWYCDATEIIGATGATCNLTAQTAGIHNYTCKYSLNTSSKTTPAKTIQVFEGVQGGLYPISLDTNDGGILQIAHVSLGAENSLSPCDMNMTPSYYQWGRLPDGHEIYGSEITTTQANNMTATMPYDVIGKFIATELDAWTSAELPAVWTNPVCPAGWHVMTLAEAKSILPTGEWSSSYSNLGLPNSITFTDAANATEGDYFTIQPKSAGNSPALLIVNKGYRKNDGSYGLVPRWWIAEYGVTGFQSLDWNTASDVAESAGFIGAGNQNGNPATETVNIQSSIAFGAHEVRCVKD